MKKIVARIIVPALVVLGLVGCGGEEAATDSEGKTEPENEELKVFTTVYPLQFFTEEIAGDAAAVESILPPGSDPHTYEPTTKEMIALADADAFIYNGAGLEPYAAKISESIEAEDVQIVEASKGIDLTEHVHTEEKEEGEGHEGHHHGDEDPHVWLDPMRSVEMAENVKETLVELMPAQEETFNENFENLKGKLEDLDQDFRDGISDLPGNKIIVSHAAYGYWEQAYGIQQLAISGLSPTNEPSQKEVQTIIDLAEKYGLEHVFFEQNVTPKIGEIVREEIGAEALRLHNLSVLTEDDINSEEDYFTLMERNLETLKKALSAAKKSPDAEEEHAHDHAHSHDEEAEKIYEGYFEDEQVKDRSLSDWEGDWQSVYPYLKDGTLNEVFAHKAEEGDKTAEEYKDYYTIGYQTDVERIVIEENTVTFYENGDKVSGNYRYDGYEILTYEAGNRGVRYIFKREDEKEGLPVYIQFSDHSIDPTKADHYHLYWGSDREELLEELTNWPTYYPSHMDGEEIADEMMKH